LKASVNFLGVGFDQRNGEALYASPNAKDTAKRPATNAAPYGCMPLRCGPAYRVLRPA
jgi:hypothetical protein